MKTITHDGEIWVRQSELAEYDLDLRAAEIETSSLIQRLDEAKKRIDLADEIMDFFDDTSQLWRQDLRALIRRWWAEK